MGALTARDVSEVFAARDEVARSFFEEQAEDVARACYAMASRFHAGGTLIVFGSGGPATDAQHVSVEFMHPVIVGKRALPSIALANDVATVTGIARTEGIEWIFARQLETLAGPNDIAMGISPDGECREVLRGLEAAAERDLLTVALLGGDGGAIAASASTTHPLIVRSPDPLAVKEIHVTAYHVLWELAHVFFEHPGVLAPGVIR